MADIREITTMCRNGQVKEAYELAKSNFENEPTNPWQQRALGWALYYMTKCAAEAGDYSKLLEYLEELKSLDLLTVENDSMIFDNVQFKLAEFIKNRLFVNDFNSQARLSSIFSILKDYKFSASKGHSYLLQSCLKFEIWPEMADFLDWWNLDNLTREDYTPFVNQQGKKIMTLAERAFIANSKSLLRLNDAGRIEEFLPKIDALMNQHPEMMYPGYFYGKLLLALGSSMEDALKVIIPFARKKATEFWVWQLLSDVFINDEEKQLACLLRAVHCHTQEAFLGKVRIKLAALYINRKQYNHARFHIDAVTRCYASQGWRLPYEIDCWIHQPWMNDTMPDGNDPINYRNITEDILCDGAEECIGIVTYVDLNSKKSTIIYGHQKRYAMKLRFNVSAGNVLNMHYITEQDGRIRVLSARKTQLPENLNYAKYLNGVVGKRDDKDFAFLNADSIRCYMSPTIVRKYNLCNGDNVKSLVVYDYEKKKDCWNWVCVTAKKM